MLPRRTLYLLPIIIGILFISCGKPRISFYEVTHDFGILKQRMTAEHIFKFVNLGKEQLLITRVKSG